ncbi:MAG: hypothetical protein JNM63_10455, partial [Spirochaetia bacterium]|nr:hypothetical protein [Spirochaetia bacterium]
LPAISLRGFSEVSSLSDILFENVTINGRTVGPDHPSLKFKDFVFNVQFKSNAAAPAVTIFPKNP